MMTVRGLIEIYYFIVQAGDCCSQTKELYLDVILLIVIIQSAFLVQDVTMKTSYCNYSEIMRMLGIVMMYLQQDCIFKVFVLTISLISHH